MITPPTRSHGKVWIEHKSKQGEPPKPGRWYPTVALRVEAFRKYFPVEQWGIRTEIVDSNEVMVCIKAEVTVLASAQQDRVIATGTAEEIRGAGYINKSNALENAETSAIGRALASFGLHGGEMASANEMVKAREVKMSTPDQLKALAGLMNDLEMVEEDTAKSLRVTKLDELNEDRAARLIKRLEEMKAAPAPNNEGES